MTHFRDKREGGVELLVVMYHNDVPSDCVGSTTATYVDNVFVRPDWNSFGVEDILQTAVPDWHVSLYSAPENPDYTAAVERVWQSKVKQWDGLEPTWGFDESKSANVFYIWASRDNLFRLAQAWAERIKYGFANLGGDDSTFDYFPDDVDGFHQLCQAIDRLDFYEETVKDIRTWYADELGEALIT